MSPKLLRFVVAALALVAGSLLATTAPAQAASPGDPTGVYRFWSAPFDNAHFFTATYAEQFQLRDSDPNWAYEGVAFHTRVASATGCASTPSGQFPVYRFFSSNFRSHFYTIDAAEADTVKTDPNWSYEGIAYCAFKTQAQGTIALYRFWSPVFGKHFYTANKSEADHIKATDTNWNSEGVAYYVEPVPIPATVLDLRLWNLTLPTGQDNNPDTVSQSALQSYTGPPYFETDINSDASSGVRFYAPTSGATTDGSSFPRSELREMETTSSGGTTQATWNNADPYKAHTMTIVQAITHLPDRKGDTDPLVAGQIHDPQKDIAVLRAQKVPSTQKIQLQARFYTSDSTPDNVVTLESDYKLGTKFKVEFKAVNGTVTLTYWKNASDSTSTSSATDAPAPGTPDWYFKAGCYPQATSRVSSSDSKYGTGWGEVIIYGLTHTHG